MGIKECFEEGKQARLKAEVEHAFNGTPIKLWCIYRRIDKFEAYTKGWHSPNELDIKIALDAAAKTQHNNQLQIINHQQAIN